MAYPAYIGADGTLTDGEAWVSIATTTLGSSAAAVTFTSTDDGQVGDFSQYMDLVIVSYARGAVAVTTAQLNMRLNNNTGYIYDTQSLYGNGANVYGSSSTAPASGTTHFPLGTLPCNNATANVFVAIVTTLFDINSAKFKSVLSQAAVDRNGAGTVHLWALAWLSQAPITEIDLFDATGAGDLATGSSFSLYGILPKMVL